MLIFVVFIILSFCCQYKTKSPASIWRDILAYIVVVFFRFLRKYFVYLLHKCIPFLAKGNPIEMLRYGLHWFSIGYKKHSCAREMKSQIWYTKNIFVSR